MNLESQLKDGSMSFMLQVNSKLYQPGENFVASPFSLLSAMLMLLTGCGTHSRAELLKVLFDFESEITDDEFAEVLNIYTRYYIELLDKTRKEMHNANFLYSQKGASLKSDYIETVQNRFKAIAKELDFAGQLEAAIETINEDVKCATKGLIDSIANDLKQTTRAVLMNAIYFKGSWRFKFNEKYTIDDEFKLSTKQMVNVKMMCQREVFLYKRCAVSQCSIVKLPYRSRETSMMLILPDEGINVQDVLQSLNSEISIKGFRKTNIWLKLPKFKLSTENQLIPTLKELNITSVFGSEADLSGIFEQENFCVSDVVQKTVIDVDEKGTVAASATVFWSFKCRFGPTIPIKFFLDRPFIFLIITNDHKTLLFSGVVEDPSQ